MIRLLPLLLLAAAGCGGGAAGELSRGPLRRVGVLAPEGELGAGEAAALRKALGDALRSRGFDVVDVDAPLRGDPWTWKTELRRAQAVDGLLRSRVEGARAEVQLVEAAGGRTLYWKEGRTSGAEALLDRGPSPR